MMRHDNGKILVVEGNDCIRQMLLTKLRSCGFYVVCAVDGLDAIQKYNNEWFDMVLSDIGMLGLTGNVLAQYIRNVSKDVPVIAVTGAPWLAGDCFDLVIEKPFELKFVVDSIEYWFMEKPNRVQHHKLRSCGYNQGAHETMPANLSLGGSHELA